MRVLLVLVAACATTFAQESRPLGLLPPESPLAPVQQSLLRGDAAEARAALDAILGTAAPEVLAAIAPQAALLRAASEPVGRRATAMLGVAAAYADGPVAEAAVVAGLAALLSDGPEVGDLTDPLLPGRAAGTEEQNGGGRSAEPLQRGPDLARFLAVLERRMLAPDSDREAIEHARALLAQFPSQAGDWVWVRPSGPSRLPARLDATTRLRFFRLPSSEGLPDPSRVILPAGAPAIDVTLPANRDDLELPALEPGAWLVVVTTADGSYRRDWPVIVTDLELVVQSIPGARVPLGILGTKDVVEAAITPFFDPRFASRTRRDLPKEPANAVLGRSGPHLAIASIVAQSTAPAEAEPRIVADLLAGQPVYAPGSQASLRLIARPARRRPESRPGLDPVPLRVVFWPRQPHEVVIDAKVAGTLALTLAIPAAAPPGPVRVHVYDAEARPAGGMPPEPVLDAIPFSVQTRPFGAGTILVSAPPSWTPGQPAPRIELQSSPPMALEAVVDLTAGSFKQNAVVRLDAGGFGAFTLGLDELGLSEARVRSVELAIRLVSGADEISKATRRIEIAAPDADLGAPLRIEVRTPRPAAGEPLEVFVQGPPDEKALLSASTDQGIAWSAPQVLGQAGGAVVKIPTEAAWWPALELVCSTRDGARRGSRLEARARVLLARPGAPALAVSTDQETYRADQTARVGVKVSTRTPQAETAVSLVVVDDLLARLAGWDGPDPDAALRPRLTPHAARATASAPPGAPAAWYAGVLGRAEPLTPPAIDPGPASAPGRGWPRGPVGRPANDVGDWPLGAACAAFVENVPLDARGEATVPVKFPSDRSGRWRVVAVVIDGEGRSVVATKTIACAATAPGDADVPVWMPSLVTRQRAFVNEPDSAGGFTATLKPARVAPAHVEQIEVETVPYPGGVWKALRNHLQPTGFPCADHLAAGIVNGAAGLARAGGGGPMRATSRPSSVPPWIEATLASLRELKTRDGYAWTRGGPTDFELTPLVLQALAIAADAGIDPAPYGAVPEMRDGFLRVAPRAFADTQGNPQAAVESEEVREHGAFLAAVPPERRALVLVETVIGMLAVDPTLTLAKSAVASLVRQSQELPGATLARAALALLRAGDRENAQTAAARAAASPDQDPVSLALRIELALVLGGDEPARAALAEKLAARFLESPWPPPSACALARRALEAHFERGSDASDAGAEATTTTKDPGADVKVTARVPSLATATRYAGMAAVPSGLPGAPVMRLSLDGRPLEGSPIRVPGGSRVRFTITAAAPEGPCALQIGVAPGMRVLSAPQGSIDAGRLLWLFRAARGSEIHAEGLVEVAPGFVTWPQCELVSLETLDVVAWGATAQFEVGPAAPESRRDEQVVAKLCDHAAVSAAVRKLADEAVAAENRATAGRALRELIDMPYGGFSFAPLLPKLAPFFDSPDVLGPLIVGLGASRSELLAPPILEQAAASPRAIAALAQSARDWTVARNLVTTWRTDPNSLSPAESRLAALVVLARLRQPDSTLEPGLWAAEVVAKLMNATLDDPDAESQWRDVPFNRNFAGLFNGARPVTGAESQGWIDVLDLLLARVPGNTKGFQRQLVPPEPGLALFGLVAAITERSRDEVALYTLPEAAFRTRQAELRAAAGARAVALLETGGLPLEAATLPLLTDGAANENVPRILRVLLSAIAKGRADAAIPLGIQVIERFRDQFGLADRAGAALAVIAAGGPPPWRVGALQALTRSDRVTLPITVVEPLLREPETRSDAIELLLERDDSADLLMTALEQRMLRFEARRVLEKLAALRPSPFERKPAARLVALLAQLDPETAKPIEDELRRRAEENPAELSAALAAARDERAREVLVRIMGKARVTEVAWDPSDPGAERLRTKLLALAADPEAGATVRQWMIAAKQAAQTQGAADAAVQDLWTYLLAYATPLDVMIFGAPAPAEALSARAATWSDAEISAFLRSAEARPDPAGNASHWGNAAVVVRLIAPGRRARFADELLSLWRSYVEAGSSFDALSLFGHLGAAQVPALREVLESPPPTDSRPGRFDDAQKLAYVSALARDAAVQREVEPLARSIRSPTIAAALARYGFEVTGHWREPPAATRPAASGPQTALDWQRALMARLENEGLAAIARPEPAILRAWEKTLRERGLGEVRR